MENLTASLTVVISKILVTKLIITILLILFQLLGEIAGWNVLKLEIMVYKIAT